MVAWLQLNVVRDVTSGLIVWVVTIRADVHLVGIILPVAALILLGDMLIVPGRGDRQGLRWASTRRPPR